MPEISKTYEPQSVESRWYDYWLQQGCFIANPASPKPAYSIVIPPPNVTGVLTLGHVLNNTIQDILARKARMEGREVLWLPGTDHAGIATQTVVEKALRKEGVIKHRDDLGREKFLARVWEWKEKHGGIIIDQLKKLGASCDWTRERFTMDPAYSQCVQKVFVDLYRQGLIYRGKRMVNWCPVSLTALSDEEVVMKEQQGALYHFKVEVAEEPGTWLTIATTRPETIPADTAVAVHPQDPRYRRFIGLHAVRPLPPELPREKRLIPIVGDDHVDSEFGTGVLKVTPAHDRADFDIGLRHGLAVVDVLHPDGRLNAQAGVELDGLDRFKGRAVAVSQLTQLGQLEKEEPYRNKVGFSERADVPIEPRLSEQWFLRYPSTELSRSCVADGRLRFFPERWTKVYDHWMANLQDWCISRQLWWGHRIPVWYHQQTGAIHCDVEPPADPEPWTQDNDVLDTWFSSWLWPFATLGWPERSPTLQRFYPTTDLVTGPDIIFFWVARMIMAGNTFMGDLPFRNVYFTGIIRDKQGRKMSKSLGNSPDPLDLIAKYGADALRFGIMRSAPLGQDVLYDEQHVELGRNFCTKLWNACRFRQMQGGEIQGEIRPELLTTDDQWILLQLDAALRDIQTAFEGYRFTEVTQILYRFFWSEYCDWYVEASKAVMQGTDPDRKANTLAVIDFVLAHTLRLFHPFLPFITEELWQGLGYHQDMPPTQGGQTIMFAPWPKPLDQDFRDHYGLREEDARRARAKYEVVSLGRNLRREFNIQSNKKVRFLLQPNQEVSAHDLEVMRLLLNAESVQVGCEAESTQGTPMLLTPLGELRLPLEGLVDLAAERVRLGKELAKTETEIQKVHSKLEQPDFMQKVPAHVLEEHRQRLAEWQTRRERVLAALAAVA
jgi:valyl-tRNA synthetase